MYTKILFKSLLIYNNLSEETTAATTPTPTPAPPTPPTTTTTDSSSSLFDDFLPYFFTYPIKRRVEPIDTERFKSLMETMVEEQRANNNAVHQQQFKREDVAIREIQEALTQLQKTYG